MNYPDLLQLWSSPANHPSRADIDAQKECLARALTRRRRAFFALMTPPAVALTLVTGLLLHRLSATGMETLAREWAAPALLLATWTTFFVFVRSFRGHSRSHADFSLSVAASLRGLLDHTLRARRRTTWLLWSHFASLPVLGLSLRQLSSAGKMAPHESSSALVFFGSVIAASLVGLLLFRSLRLRPEELRLRELLRAYGE